MGGAQKHRSIERRGETLKDTALARPRSLRDIPSVTWSLLLVAVVLVAYELSQLSYSLIGALPTAAPVLFAAAVLYVRPADRRYTWAALALAVAPVVSLVWSALPEAVFRYAPGDWRNAAYSLQDMGPIVRDATSVITIAGLGLLGLALGGVRRPLSVAILGVSVVIAIVHAIAIADSYSAINYPPGDSTPMILLARSIVVSMLTLLGWAFVFAAALESRRTLMLIGTGLVFVITAQSYVPLMSDAVLNNGVLLTALAAVHLLGWALVIVAALRGELNAAPSRTAAPV